VEGNQRRFAAAISVYWIRIDPRRRLIRVTVLDPSEFADFWEANAELTTIAIRKNLSPSTTKNKPEQQEGRTTAALKAATTAKTNLLLLLLLIVNQFASLQLF